MQVSFDDALARSPDICLLIPSLTGGGAERVCCLLANQWASEGRNVLLVVLQARGRFLDQIDGRVGLLALNRERARHAARDIARLMEPHRRTPLLVFGFELGVVAGLLRLLQCLPGAVIYREGNDPRVFISPRRRWLYALALGWVDAGIAQVRYARDELRRLGMGTIPIRVLPNPIPAGWQSLNADAPARPSSLTLLAVGRMVPQKGFERLLQGFGHLARTDPNARLVLAGEGELTESLRQLAGGLGLGQQVEFLGFIQDMRSLYASNSLFVLSSYYEGQPNVLLEALLAGSKVLAAGGEPVREFLEDLELGECFLSSDDFGEEFARKVRIALSLPDAKWHAARNRLLEMANLRKVADSYWSFCHGQLPPVLAGVII